MKDLDANLGPSATCWLWEGSGPSSWLSRFTPSFCTQLCALGAHIHGLLCSLASDGSYLREALTREDMGGEWGRGVSTVGSVSSAPPSMVAGGWCRIFPHLLALRLHLPSRGFLHILALRGSQWPLPLASPGAGIRDPGRHWPERRFPSVLPPLWEIAPLINSPVMIFFLGLDIQLVGS